LNWIDINNTFVTVLGYPLSYVEFIGTVTGFFSVWLAAKSNVLTWPIGLINVFCFFCIFYQVRLYSDMFLQVYFFVISIYGWIAWKNQDRKKGTPIKTISEKQRIMVAIIILLVTLSMGTFVKNIHTLIPAIFISPASYPYIDTFVAVLSVIATVLLARRKIENWILWIIVDIISVVLYAKKHVLFISIEYGIFMCLATLGLLTWLKLLRNEKRIGHR